MNLKNSLIINIPEASPPYTSFRALLLPAHGMEAIARLW